MAKTIAVSDEVYKLLERSKLPGESFSDVILKGLKKGTILDIKGSQTLSKADWDKARLVISQAERETERQLGA